MQFTMTRFAKHCVRSDTYKFVELYFLHMLITSLFPQEGQHRRPKYVQFFSNYLTLKMETIFFKILVTLYQASHCHIPEEPNP